MGASIYNSVSTYMFNPITGMLIRMRLTRKINFNPFLTASSTGRNLFFAGMMEMCSSPSLRPIALIFNARSLCSLKTQSL